MDLNEIYESIIYEKSLPEIINNVSEYLGKALMLVDNSFRILSYSTVYSVSEKDWLDCIKRGFCNYEMVEDIRSILSRPTSLETNIFYIDTAAHLQKKLFLRIHSNDCMLGYLILFTEEKPDQELIDTLKKLSKVVTYVAKNLPEFNRLLNDDIDNILISFINGEDHRQLTSRMTDLGYHLPKTFCIAASNPRNSTGNDIQYIVQYMRSEYPSCLCVFFRGYIYAVMDTKDAHDLDSLRKKYQEHAVIVQMIGQIGVSDDCTDPSQLTNGCRQARMSLVFAERMKYEPILCHYRQFRVYDLFGNCDEDALRDNISQSIALIQHCDRETGSELLKTLRSYLQNNCSIRECAADLFIHRNTLSYRLAKIEELTGQDLSQMNVRFELALSLSILDYLNNG